MPLTRAIGLALATAACAQPEEGSDDAPATVLHLYPPSVYFGLIDWGSTATQEITISNDGGEAVDVAGLRVSTDEFHVDDAGAFTIPAGDGVQRTLEWTPSTIRGLDGQLEVLGADAPYTRAFVTGGTSHASAKLLDNDTVDFGRVPLGCKRVERVGVSNEGLATLVLSWVPDVTQVEFSLRDSSGNSLETPISIEPRAGELFDLEYGPTMAHEIESTLEFETNDPLSPTVGIDVRGVGLGNEPQTAEWTVAPDLPVIVFHVNQDVLSGPWLDHFAGFFDALFDELLAANVPFRVAFTQDPDGEVAGPVPFIDDSFLSWEAVDAAWGMLPFDSGDNDAGLGTGLATIKANADWALDDRAPWPQAKLNVVSINRDEEQSPRDWVSYVDELEDLRGSSNVAVHGIAGDLPGGCSHGALSAQPSTGLNEASVATDGAFVSICREDWQAAAATLVAACTRFGGFRFPDPPVPDSIEVSVDGAEVSTGWWYDAKTNELEFDEASFPSEGAEVRARYVLAESCE